MKTKRLLWLILTLALIGLPLTAQTGAAVFAPYVSRLSGEARNNFVRLSWVDSVGVRGPVHIYRSGDPFDSATPLAAMRPVIIPYGVQSYIDEVENEGTFYYFVAACDEAGRSYDIPIAFTNTISVQVSLGAAFSPSVISERAPAAPVAPSARTEAPPPRGISSIEAEAQEDKVIITFLAGDVRSATLYRSTRPIRETPDLLGAVIIRTQINSPFTDNPVPGIPYYYAIVAEDDLVRGTVQIVPGRNATRIPVEASIPGTTPRGRDLRPMPLPQISVPASGMETNAGIPRSTQLSPEAANALGDIPPRPQVVPEMKKPRVFARDLESSAARGEDYTLTSIIRGPFSAKDWETARDQLTRFLALPRSSEAIARARFYLGQCHYFLKRPREGLFEFLAIQERYPAEAREWIQASLDMMRN